MKRSAYGPLTVGLFVAITLLVSSEMPSHAGGHHHGARVFVGVGVGVPFWYPFPYVYPYPVYSPPLVVESSPPVYVQRDPQPQYQQQYWYFCQGSQTYYPYVKECPGGWLQVVPQTSPPPQTGAPR